MLTSRRRHADRARSRFVRPATLAAVSFAFAFATWSPLAAQESDSESSETSTSSTDDTTSGDSESAPASSTPITIAIPPPTIDPAELARLTEELSTLRGEEVDLSRAQDELSYEVDVLTVDHDELTAEVRILDTTLRRAENEVARNEADLSKARQELSSAHQAVMAMRDKVSAQQDTRDSLLVRAYLNEDDGRGGNDLIRSQQQINDGRYRQELIYHHVGTVTEVVEELGVLQAAAEDARLAREELHKGAEVAQLQADAALEMANDARRERALLLADIAVRLDARLGESAILAEQGVELSDEIAEQEAELAGLVSVGGAPRPDDVAGARAASISRATSAANFSEGSIVRVQGIRVHEIVAADFGAMLLAAKDAGYTLSGWGYRSVATQISLRRQHCGTSDYAIYVQSSSTCNPPTATPGNSMHERGLAVDITVNGSIIGRRSQPEFQWLARNAANYGFYNLPSEPWHWSINGN